MATSLGVDDHPEMVDSEVTATSSDCDAAATLSACSQNKKPTCVIVLGMAGSGKTTFVQVIAHPGSGLKTGLARPGHVNFVG